MSPEPQAAPGSWLERIGREVAAPLVTAVASPCDPIALEAVLEATAAGFVQPILIGPRVRIAAAAAMAGYDLSPFAIVDARDDADAAALAVAEVTAGRAHALMKGSLHSDTLLHAVIEAPALRTSRRMSHCYVLVLPGRSEPLILTDTVVNVSPNLEEKADIVRNAIELATLLGFPGPLVAVLAAVETVNPRMPSTIDAAALSKMAERGQIAGGIVDGPLAFDDAIDPDAAAAKGIVSRVAGHANVLVVPDLDAGNILAKELEFIGHAEVAGIVLGAAVPIVLTSRAESVRARVASCALAAFYARFDQRSIAARRSASFTGLAR